VFGNNILQLFEGRGKKALQLFAAGRSWVGESGVNRYATHSLGEESVWGALAH